MQSWPSGRAARHGGASVTDVKGTVRSGRISLSLSLSLSQKGYTYIFRVVVRPPHTARCWTISTSSMGCNNIHGNTAYSCNVMKQESLAVHPSPETTSIRATLLFAFVQSRCSPTRRAWIRDAVDNFTEHAATIGTSVLQGVTWIRREKKMSVKTRLE